MKPTLRRPAGLLLAAAVALVSALLWSSPAAAHGGAKIAVNSDGRGSVWVSVTSDDGHPYDGFIDASLSARETDGTAIAPAKLVQSSAPGTLVYMSTLPAGSWNVTVEFGPPIARTCAASFQVGASNNTQTSNCDAPTPLAASGSAAATKSSSGTAWLLIGVAAVGGVVVAVLALMLRRRRDTERAAAPRGPARKAKAGSRR
ncbi:hypothetical protein DFJ67_4686 [Asanoa ferruginea]|uniref:Uncharacterized protein n=1 Tax=Asanoa ferruginea TaxID=53367 RepID=A0A3D9ZMS7_9ACTN|nr:hypothetical protein [Asanoa ferruginea]REF98668.1 hypothetical protein DFJ67_4686 [Asanoa ferruginea]GIF50683.1 hypothetical protein Afe04nite_52220 [Asanoa ferruginea]